jgi:hypothetical protein
MLDKGAQLVREEPLPKNNVVGSLFSHLHNECTREDYWPRIVVEMRTNVRVPSTLQPVLLLPSMVLSQPPLDFDGVYFRHGAFSGRLPLCA